MKITIVDEGDRSVGIEPYSISIELHEEVTDEIRDTLRNGLVELIGELYNMIGYVGAYFEDECPDCGQKLDKHNDNTCIRGLQNRT